MYSPNPVIDILNIDLLETLSNVEIHVYDLNSKLLTSQKLRNVEELDLNMSDFDSGVYFVEVQTNKGYNKIKIIKN